MNTFPSFCGGLVAMPMVLRGGRGTWRTRFSGRQTPDSSEAAMIGAHFPIEMEGINHANSEKKGISSTNTLIDRSINQLINQSLINQSINQLINQSNQSVDQLTSQFVPS